MSKQVRLLFSLILSLLFIGCAQAQIAQREEINKLLKAREATYFGCGEIMHVNMTPGEEGYKVHIEDGPGLNRYFFVEKTEGSKWLPEGALIDIYLLPGIHHRVIPVKSCERTVV